MNPVIIPPEIVSLVHHIELNKEGWWEKALQQLILAAVWLSNGNISAQEIIDWAKANMSSHKVPVYVEFRDDLPKQGVKLLRRILRDEEEAKRSK